MKCVLRECPLFYFLHFLFESEVLAYNYCKQLRYNKCSENKIWFTDIVNETGDKKKLLPWNSCCYDNKCIL